MIQILGNTMEVELMNKTWIELSVKTTTEAVEAVSNILIETGAEGVMIEDQIGRASCRERVSSPV